MIITIDGPTASGKYICGLLAQKLGYYYVNSGLLYRALGYILVQEQGNTLKELENLSHKKICNSIDLLRIQYVYGDGHAQILLDDHDITNFLRDPDISQAASIISTNQEIRNILLKLQRLLGQHHNIIIDGRDAGTIVFPHAQYKFFLTADPQVRALRFMNDQRAREKLISFEQAYLQLQERDTRDTARPIAPLRIPPQAIIIDTSNYTQEEVVNLLISYIKEL